MKNKNKIFIKAGLVLGLGLNCYSHTYEIDQGWNLLGAEDDINISNFNTTASLLWVYKEGTWKVASPDGSKENSISTSIYKDDNLTKVSKGFGFWVYSLNGGSVNTSNEQNQTLFNYKIVDTAQSKCYNSTSGDQENCMGKGYDADYTTNPQSYSLNTNGTIVTDNVTGLMWTKSSDLDNDGVSSDVDDKRSYDDAVAYCSNLSLEGYDDWRLPDIKTLYSLMNFTGEDPSGYSGSDTSSLKLFIDDNYFERAFGDQNEGERIIDGQYASSTKYVSTTMNGDETMFGVNFVDGRIKGYPLSMQDEDKLFYVLCTRGNESYGENNFTDNGDMTISDNATGLMWQKDDNVSSDFEDALTTCEDATTAGYSDWRLPDIKELQSIVDYERSPDTTNTAAIDPIFNTTSFTNEEGVIDWGYYWSSTTHATDHGGQAGAYVSFGRALGYMNGSILDVHGAGSQRSNSKVSESGDPAAQSTTGYGSETFYYKGPQGDILRVDNMVRCVRDN